jgi:hypothetical protein
MPRPQRPWFRFYTEAINDPKLEELTPAQRWLWVTLLAVARESPQSGRLLRAEGVPWRSEALGRRAGLKAREAQEGLKEMEKVGLIAWDDCWVIPRWRDRQFESDDVTARTQRHRNDVGTTLERSISVPGNDVGTHQRTETDTENNNPPLVPPVVDVVEPAVGEIERRIRPSPIGFEKFWEQYPRKIGKGAAKRAWTAAVRKVGAEPLVAAAASYSRQREGQDAKFTPYPATWLNREQWLDVPDGPCVSERLRGIEQWVNGRE